MKNKKTYFLSLIIILLILLCTSIVLISNNKIQINKVDNVVIYNSWVRYKDEFFSTQLVEFVGDPISNDLVVFDDSTVKFCNFIVQVNEDE